MKNLRAIVIGVPVLAVVAAAWLFMSSPLQLMLSAFGPKGAFEPAMQSRAPDYARPENWAALPTAKGLTDQTPKGVAPRTGPAPVDVFFIHPTGYIAARTWTSPMDPASATEDNTRWMMINQASVFNGCCDIYAPRYREAALHVFFGDKAKRDQILDFSYQDVDRAFDYFLTHYSKGRPFIIASHSQGSYHAMTLLERRIDGTPLRDRMVAAYVIGVPGGDVTVARLARLKTIKACDSATDLHCMIHYATYVSGSKAQKSQDISSPMVCVNPLTWRNDGPYAPASQHKGAVRAAGAFFLNPLAKDVSKGTVFGPLDAPVPGATFAECKDGMLLVKDLAKAPFTKGQTNGAGNYHLFDYPLFAMDLRENAVARVEAYMKAQPAASR